MAVSLAAEPIAQIGSFTITNSLINAWMVAIILISAAAVIRFSAKQKTPSGFLNFVEFCFESILNVCDSVTRDRARSIKFFPIVTTFFIFILLNNWLGQLPGTGTIGVWGMMHGHLELIPILRPATADLNLTLALGGFAILSTHVMGIATLGFFKHTNKYIQLGSLAKSFKKGPIGILTGVVEFGVGLIEIAGEFARAISLSLRLFGNIFAGEVLITVMLSLAAVAIPLPFQLLEFLVGMIQATVFSILTLVFLTLATEKPHGDHGDEHEHKQVAHEAH